MFFFPAMQNGRSVRSYEAEMIEAVRGKEIEQRWRRWLGTCCYRKLGDGRGSSTSQRIVNRDGFSLVALKYLPEHANAVAISPSPSNILGMLRFLYQTS